MTCEHHARPIAEYARVIYEAWDKDGHKPPAGYASWMAYWEFEFNSPQGQLAKDREYVAQNIGKMF